MKLIVIDGPKGIRKVQEGLQFRLEQGERVLGYENSGDEVEIRSASQKTWVIDKLASYFGIAVADLIFFAAKAFRIPHCSMCEMRYKVLHVIDQIGLRKAVKLIGYSVMGIEMSDEDVRLVEEAFNDKS